MLRKIPTLQVCLHCTVSLGDWHPGLNTQVSLASGQASPQKSPTWVSVSSLFLHSPVCVSEQDLTHARILSQSVESIAKELICPLEKLWEVTGGPFALVLLWQGCMQKVGGLQPMLKLLRCQPTTPCPVDYTGLQTPPKPGQRFYCVNSRGVWAKAQYKPGLTVQ